jgi:hypothetical protein
MKVECYCPKCATRYLIDEVRLGRKAACAKCGEKFTLRPESDEERRRRERLQASRPQAASARTPGLAFRADPVVLKILDTYSGQLPLEQDEKLLTFVSADSDPENIRSGLLLTTARLFFFDPHQEINLPLSKLVTARVLNPLSERAEAFAGLTQFGSTKAAAATRLRINDNLFCLLAPRHFVRRLIRNLSVAKSTSISMQPACTHNDIAFVEKNEKGMALEVPTGTAVEFPDECARCGSTNSFENFRVHNYYVPYCTEHFREDKGFRKKGCAVKVLKSGKLITRLLFAREEYAQKFIALNTGMTT